MSVKMIMMMKMLKIKKISILRNVNINPILQLSIDLFFTSTWALACHAIDGVSPYWKIYPIYVCTVIADAAATIKHLPLRHARPCIAYMGRCGTGASDQWNERQVGVRDQMLAPRVQLCLQQVRQNIFDHWRQHYERCWPSSTGSTVFYLGDDPTNIICFKICLIFLIYSWWKIINFVSESNWQFKLINNNIFQRSDSQKNIPKYRGLIIIIYAKKAIVWFNNLNNIINLIN